MTELLYEFIVFMVSFIILEILCIYIAKYHKMNFIEFIENNVIVFFVSSVITMIFVTLRKYNIEFYNLFLEALKLVGAIICIITIVVCLISMKYGLWYIFIKKHNKKGKKKTTRYKNGKI